MLNESVCKLLKNSQKHITIIIPLGYNGIIFSRALSNRNIPVIGIFPSKRECFRYTNSCEKVFVGDVCNETLLDVLIEMGRMAAKKPVLIPVSDLKVILFSKHREILKNYFLFNIPEQSALNILMYKTMFYEWGHRDYSFPKTIMVSSGKDIVRASKELEFPIIFKPKYRNPEWLKIHLSKASIFSNYEDVIEFYDRAKKLEADFLISEYIPGGDENIETCHVYYNNGKLLATYTDKKIRQNPPLTGTGSFISSCRNEFIRNKTVNIFNRLNYTGIGGMEYKKDSRTGKFKIIEPFSGRPSSHFYTGLGEKINLPYLVYKDIIGESIPLYKQSSKIVSQLDEEPDLRSLIYYIKKRDLTITAYLNSLITTRLFVRLSFKDPLVGLIFFINLIVKIIRKIKP